MNTNRREYKNRFKIKLSSALICVPLCLIACFLPAFAQAQDIITVAVASSLYPAMQRQAKAFEKNHDTTIRLVPGSTGRLYNQIMQGAPFDVFIAADQTRPAMLESHGKAVAQFEVGQGYLGMMVGNHVTAVPEQLTALSIRHIAIANPDVAPFGQATRTVLQKHGLWDALKHKFVYAENAMQALVLVKKGLVDAGFVPVGTNDASLAVIHYHGVLLVDRGLARLWLKSIIVPQNTHLVLRKP